MSKRPTIVVTGIGCLTPIGHGVENFWQALLDGKNGVDTISCFDVSDYSTKIAAEIRDFNPDDYMPKKESKRMDRVLQFSVAAAKMALEDSGLVVDDSNRERIGVCIGSGIGGMHTYEHQHQTLLEQGPRKVSPFFIPMMIPNMASGQVSLQFGLKGPSFSVVSACATGVNGIAQAMDQLLTGRVDVILAGGTESAICPLAMAGFCAMRAMSTRNDDPKKASRPFDKERDGFVMGEGAGVLVLETLEHATARGAKIYAELAGYGCTNDAHHITNPDGVGAAQAMRIALRDAGLQPEDIHYINAHATSTPVGDPMESQAIRNVFGEHTDRLAVSSTKSMIGHTLGATGALETICCVLAVQRDIVPPTINFEFPDPECVIDCVPNVARRMEVKAALNNSFGFGGHNAVVVVKKHLLA